MNEYPLGRDGSPTGLNRGWVRRFNVNVFNPQPRVHWETFTGSDGEIQVRKRPRPVSMALPMMADGYGGGANAIPNLNVR